MVIGPAGRLAECRAKARSRSAVAYYYVILLLYKVRQYILVYFQAPSLIIME